LAFGDLDLASSYFMQRLAAVRQAEKLPASAQFDLARTPLSDDDLEQVVNEFRDQPQPHQGWGLAEGLQQLLSREPHRVPVSDIKALQTNLVASGYAPPDATLDGQWTPSWYAAFRRFDRDNFYSQQAGRHWYSAPIESGIRAITNTLPSRVFQGIVGSAKGFVQQTPETAERLGLAGGALAGAGIGTVIAPGVGTAVGAVAGGAIGFLADFMHHDDSEGDQSGLAMLLDALSPYEEYKQQGPKAFWEDLGYVLTAASLASGVGAAAKGLTAGAAGIRAAQLTEEAGAAGRAFAVGPAGASTTEAIMQQPGSWIRAALMPAKAAGQTELGAFGTITRAAARKFLPGTPAALENTLAKYSPIAFMHRLGPNVALKVFGGLSQAQMGGRLFGGIGQGGNVKFAEAKAALEANLGRNLTEEEEKQLSTQTASTAIEKSIAEAPRLKTGIDLPLVGDLADVAAFVLYPEKLLPFRGASIARGAVNVMGDTALLPFAHAVMDGESMSLRTAVNKVKETLTPIDNAYLRADYGINREATEIVRSAYRDNAQLAIRRRGMEHARADVIRQIRSEIDQHGFNGSDTLKRVQSYSVLDQTDFESWLIGLNGEKRGLDRLQSWKAANELARKTEREVQENTRYLRKDGEIIGAEAWLPTDPVSVPYMGGEFTRPAKQQVKIGGVTQTKVARDIDLLSMKDRIAALEVRAKKYEATAARGTTDPWTVNMLREQARLTRSEMSSIQKTFDDLSRLNKKTPEYDRFRIAPARKDFASKQVISARRKEFLGLRDEVLKAPGEQARIIAKKKLSDYVDQLAADGFINEKIALRAKIDRPGKQIADVLEEYGRGAASEVTLPPRIAQEFDALGYKAVSTGDDVIFPDQLKQMTEISGIGDYTRRAAFWETIGLSPRVSTDRSIFHLRHQHELSEVRQVLDEEAIAMSPSQAMTRLHSKLKEINHDGAVLGPLTKGKGGKPRLYKVDVRDLSVEDVFRAFEDVPGFTDDTAHKLFGALRRGAAYGGELKLLHPVDSMRQIGVATRTNGLPGFADVVRSWKANVPMRMDRRAWTTETFHYKAPASTNPALDLAHSAERSRAEVALKEVASKSRVSEGQRMLGMALLDSSAVAQVKAGRFETVDDFFKHLDVQHAERYATPAPGALLQTRSRDELKFLYSTFADNANWYERSSRTLADIFQAGTRTRFPLAEGEIDDLDLFTQILAATSPRTPVADNMTQAIGVFEKFKQGSADWGSVPGVMKSKHKMLDDIARGRTIDQWEEATRQGVYKVGEFKGMPREARERMKVWNFYHNLRGDLDKVTVDTWMGTLFGHEGPINPAVYDNIEFEIKRVAEEVGAKPAQVQAALWTAIKEEVVAHGGPKSLLDSRSFAELSEPLKGVVAKHAEKANGYALLQQVQDDILGATEFGGDYPTIMKFFRNADFTTLVHEDAHMLRRLLAPEDVGVLERAYGIRTVTPHGPSDELRAIAREYHDTSGVPFDARAQQEYADVDIERAKRIGDAFENQTPTPTERKTIRAYQKFASETMDQYHLLVSKGYKFIPWGGEGQPYGRAADFIKDVRENKRIYYFKTLQPDAFGKGEITAAQIRENPLLADSGIVLTDSAGNAYKNTFNDIFRAVHDIFGHAKEGVETGARGEENAWRQHARMYSEEARKAMTTETRGQNSWVNFGPHLRNEAGDVPKMGEPGYVRPQDRPFSDQKVMLLPEEFSHIPAENPHWTPEAEERFARDAEKYITARLQPGAHGPVWTALESGLGALWGSMRSVATDRNAVPREIRQILDKQFGKALELKPPSRTSVLGKDIRSKQVLGGAAAGAVLGATEGDDSGDIMRGAVLGASAGFVTRGALKRSYGYLPDALARLNTALRYTLSFTFDAGRYTEQNSIAMAKFGLPPMLSPTKYIKAREWKTPFRNGPVRGEEAWKDAVRLWDEINGTTYFQNIDDLDRRMYQAGMLGFSPRNWEAAQAFQLYQRGMKAENIRSAIADIGRYGLGRSAAEKSANFIVFPFSFSKKYLTTLGDFMLQAPARNLILHETMRRYYESEWDEKFNDFLSRRAPLLKELATVNNLFYGISPGRFFLQGLSDHRTNVGKAAQIMASFFVPSGAATPLAEAAGNVGDLAIHALAPVVITGESINRAGGIDSLEDVFARYIPLVREMNQYFTGPNAAVPRQARAFMEGGDSYWQFSKYQDGLRAAKADLEPIAMAMGNTTVDGFLQSDVGQLVGGDLDRERQRLADEYPSGFRMSQDFTNTDAIDEQALVDLANKPSRTEGEDQILRLAEEVKRWDLIQQITGLDSTMTGALAANDIRTQATQFAADKRFAELWDRFFLRDYGPIRRVA
jgi:hypothetical protein